MDEGFSPKIAESTSTRASFALPTRHHIVDPIVFEDVVEIDVKNRDTIQHVFSFGGFRPWDDR
ncbi:MAG: hypothetical protein ACR2RE_06545 [Geminicoccaceae bacterium]